MKFNVILYEKENGSVPVADFITTQPNKMQAKILHKIELLEDYGNELEGRYSKHLEDGIFELRIKFSSNITRVLYFFHTGKKIILTNGFLKKTQKTPKAEIIKAKKYRMSYLLKE